MPRYLSHDLAMDGHETLDHHAKSYLAIIDLESYPSLANKKADHLDLLSHMCHQVQALTAIIWETPAETLKLDFVLTKDGRMSNEMTHTHRLVFDGCVRTTSGQLCLTDDEQLLASSRRGDRDLLHGKAAPDERIPHIFQVPPGVFNVGVFCKRTVSYMPELDNGKIDYTVLMRHYPFPPPRVAPVRLTGGLIPWAGEDGSAQPWGGQHAA